MTTQAQRRELWMECALTLLDRVPFSSPEAQEIVVNSMRLPQDLRGPVMVRALAKKYGLSAGLTREQFEVCVFAPAAGLEWRDPAARAV